MTKRLTIFYQNARMIYLLTAKIQTPVCLLHFIVYKYLTFVKVKNTQRMTKRLTIFYQNARMIYLLTAKIQTPVCLLS